VHLGVAHARQFAFPDAEDVASAAAAAQDEQPDPRSFVGGPHERSAGEQFVVRMRGDEQQIEVHPAAARGALLLVVCHVSLPLSLYGSVTFHECDFFDLARRVKQHVGSG
jgi:hypothetical protein